MKNHSMDTHAIALRFVPSEFTFLVFQAQLKNLTLEIKVNNYKLPNSVNNP